MTVVKILTSMTKDLQIVIRYLVINIDNNNKHLKTVIRYSVIYILFYFTIIFSSGDIWTGLFQLHSGDPCSLRWASDCSRPEWTDFADLTYRKDNYNYCTVIDKDINFVKKACDQSLQFVCEIKTGTRI